MNEGGEWVRGLADLALKSSRIVDFGDKSSGFADLKNTVDRGSAESFGPVSVSLEVRIVDRNNTIFGRPRSMCWCFVG